MSKSFRLGIDFGYAYTGIALLNSDNEVLGYKVLKHRNDISKTLQERRVNRGQRRRKLSKIRRLRDFYALLKGMGIEPKHAKSEEKSTWKEKAFLGNRLYALAHYRGWDYASLLEMLISWQDEDKPPVQPPIVKAIDKVLIQEFQAPVEFKERKKEKEETKKKYEEAKQKALKELSRNSNSKTGKRFSLDAIKFVHIKDGKTCLGELWEIAKEIYASRKKLEKNPDTETEEYLAELEGKYEKLQSQLRESNVEDIEDWIKKRLNLIYSTVSLKPDESQIILRVMTMLGLKTGENLFKEGKIYRPHRNRHRDEMLDDLQRLMKVACDMAGEDDLQGCLNETFSRLEKSNLNKNKKVLSKKEVEKDWKQTIEIVNQRAMELAQRTDSSPEEIKERWIRAAKKIVNREYRKKRFENRNSMGKCPAKSREGHRCGRNVPKKKKENIRKLQFEIELRQMNVERSDERTEKLSEDEVNTIMDKLIFEKEPTRESIQKNQEVLKCFFTKKKGNRYVPPAKNGARGRKEILKDIACGEQSGRAGFCVHHLKEKLRLLREGATQSEEWKQLHEERILTLKDDAPPSIRQKVQKTVGLVRQILKEQGVSEINNSSINHIGVETARFDISLLAQDEGKKLKKKQYQQSVGGDMRSLRQDQSDHCIFCGDFLYADAHRDHLFPKAKGGGNVALNKVVGHAICNINKYKNSIPLHKEVLDSIKNKNKKKYNFILRRLEKDGRLPQDMLDAPQHTMLGAKLLKGALMEEFDLAPERIRKIRPSDSSYLRKSWFPFMNRQKQAIRKKTRFKKAEVGKEWKLDIEKLNLDKELFTGELSISRLEKEGNWLKINKTDKTTEILGTPKPGEEGDNKFLIKNDNSNQCVMEIVKNVKDENNEDKVKVLHKTTRELNQQLTLPLKDIFSKDKTMKKLLEDPDVAIQVEFRGNDKHSEQDWLKVEKGILIGTPTNYPRKNNTNYVPWCDLRITHKNTGEIYDEYKIRNHVAEMILRVTVEPSKDDPIREFHHALDAVVLGANVNWDGIERLPKDIMREQEREENAPVFKNPIGQDKEGNLQAPQLSPRWYVEDKKKKESTKCRKTDLEPLRVVGDKVFQRKSLDNISRKDLEHIQSEKIREAMNIARREIDKTDTDGKKKQDKIAQSYFLNLDKQHILHPNKTRSALCKVGNTGPKQMFLHGNQNPEKSHRFKRTVSWQEVQVIRYKNSNESDKTDIVRFAPKFYWKEKKNPRHERNEVDKELPNEYEVLAIFKRGDLVEIKQKNGKWRITKLGKTASIRNIETLEPASTVAYTNLTRIDG